MSIGKALGNYIEMVGQTQKELAQQMQVSEQMMSDVIRGRRRMSINFAIRFERVTGANAEKWLYMQLRDDLRQARARDPWPATSDPSRCLLAEREPL